MPNDDAATIYGTAVKNFIAAEAPWRKRMLEPNLNRAEAAAATAEIQRLFDEMQGSFQAFLTQRLPKA